MTDYAQLPERLRGGAKRWIEQGIQPGSFLTAVICNNLREVFGQADDGNRAGLFQIVFWFYNEAPGLCWGNVARAQKWAARFENQIELEWPEE